MNRFPFYCIRFMTLVVTACLSLEIVWDAHVGGLSEEENDDQVSRK